MVTIETILKRAYQEYPESLCWYGSSPSKQLDDNESDRLRWVKGYMAALKDQGQSIEDPDGYLDKLQKEYTASIREGLHMSLEDFFNMGFVEMYTEDWWKGVRLNRIVKLCATIQIS